MSKAAWIIFVVVLEIVGTLQASVGGEAMRANQPEGVIIVPTEGPETRSSIEISIIPTFGSDSEQFPQVLGGVLTTKQSFQVMPFDLRYRVGSKGTLSLEVPYIRRYQELQFAGESISATGAGIGDIGVGFEKTFRRERMSGWEGTFGLNLRLPTGRNVYDGLGDNELALGTGHYEIGAMLDFRRIADPLVTNIGLGLSYTLPRTYGDEHIRPGFGFTIRSGIGYALNDRWVLVEQLEYTRRPNVLLQGATTVQTELFDQAYITHGLIYNPFKDSNTYSLRFSLGLNNSSTDFVLCLSAGR